MYYIAKLFINYIFFLFSKVKERQKEIQSFFFSFFWNNTFILEQSQPSALAYSSNRSSCFPRALGMLTHAVPNSQNLAPISKVAPGSACCLIMQSCPLQLPLSSWNTHTTSCTVSFGAADGNFFPCFAILEFGHCSPVVKSEVNNTRVLISDRPPWRWDVAQRSSSGTPVTDKKFFQLDDSETPGRVPETQF